MLADPQLVDPHTYPGRPWPLSALSIAFSDLYLRRSYNHLLRSMTPDTLFFLGDLFDGGREWSTSHSISPDARYKGYGNNYWLKEYSRFQSIFLDQWRSESRYSKEPRGRKLIASLPGNHDLGFASGVQIPVKQRFEAYFGGGNRVDMIGNHSFISVDTVSLSAMDQVDPATGSSGAGDGTSQSAANREIWSSTSDFLAQVRDTRNRAAELEYHALTNQPELLYKDPGLKKYNPSAIDISTAPAPSATSKNPNIDALFPSILLTHVPLYRPPDTDCGPHREHGHAIAVQAGYQYQNVLTPSISKDLVTRIGVDDLAQVYSGDDHDYCEIQHGEFSGSVREITVKSVSMAMGVKRPGFVAVSLWNPVDTSNPANPAAANERDTIQNHLCLLPDEIGILMRYAQLLALTLLVLAVQTLRAPLPAAHPLLPTTSTSSSSFAAYPPPQHSTSTNSNPNPSTHSANNSTIFRYATSTSNFNSNFNPQPHPAGTAKLGTYGNIPPTSRSASPSKNREKKLTGDPGYGNGYGHGYPSHNNPSHGYAGYDGADDYKESYDEGYDEGYSSDAAGDTSTGNAKGRRGKVGQRYKGRWRRKGEEFGWRVGRVAGPVGGVFVGLWWFS